MIKKLFRQIFNDDYFPDDELLHIFFDSSMFHLDITVYAPDIYSEAVFTKKCYNKSMKKEYLKRQGYSTDLTDKQWEEIVVGMREYKYRKPMAAN